MVTSDVNIESRDRRTMEASPPLLVLLVDDDLDALNEMREVLHNHNIPCDIAGDGKVALQILQRRQDIGIVVTDVRMPSSA